MILPTSAIAVIVAIVRNEGELLMVRGHDLASEGLKIKRHAEAMAAEYEALSSGRADG